MNGLDRADRAALGMLLVLCEPLLILGIVGAGACLLTMVNWIRRFGPGDSGVWVLFGMTVASFVGATIGAEHITQILGAAADSHKHHVETSTCPRHSLICWCVGRVVTGAQPQTTGAASTFLIVRRIPVNSSAPGCC